MQQTQRAPRGWAVVAICWFALALASAAPAAAQTAARELLNSERIAAAFGSYGVEVLEVGEQVRVSSLYSGASGDRTCRTFAVVRYTGAIDAAIAAEHDAIVAGGSIGAVFAANGWQVRKTHLRYAERRATALLARLMRVPEAAALAEHVYVLDVEKGGRVIEYAALVEIHHPDYLRLADLAGIYGPADPRARPDVLAELLAAAAAHTVR